MPRKSRFCSPPVPARACSRAQPPYVSALVGPGLLLAALAACESAAAPRAGGFALAAAGSQTRAGEVGLAVEPVSVRLTNRGLPVRGVLVSWATDDGSLPDAARSRTDADGIATMGWTLGPKPGAYTLTASMQGTADVQFSATATVGPLARLQIWPRIASLSDVGDTVVLDALGTDRYGNRVPITNLQWRTLQPLIASVSGAGTVTGLTGGTARIVASAGAAADTVTVVVQPQPASVMLTTRSATLRALGATVALQAVVRDRFGNPIPGVLAGWSSLDTTVARVDARGVVTAVRNGLALIRVAAGMNADTAQVSVAQVPGRIVFQPSAITLGVGDRLEILPAVYDSLGSPMLDVVLIWSSSDATIARVLRPGLIECLQAGTTTVVASGGTAAGWITITVRPSPAASAAVAPDGTSRRPEASRTLALRPQDAFRNDLPGITIDRTAPTSGSRR